MSDPMKKNAERYKEPFESNPIRVVPPSCHEKTVLRPWQANGDSEASADAKVWHHVNPTRFSAPLPPESKGPIFGTGARKKKGVAGA